MNTKRRKITALVIVLLLALLVPMHRTQGETSTWHAVCYSITHVQERTVQDHRLGTLSGTRIRILLWTVRDDTAFTPDDIEGTITGTPRG